MTGPGQDASLRVEEGRRHWREAVDRVRAARTEAVRRPNGGPAELAVVVPCFDEEAVLPEAVVRIADLGAGLVAERRGRYGEAKRLAQFVVEKTV